MTDNKKITKKEVNTIVVEAESRIRNRYIDKASKILERKLEERQFATLVLENIERDIEELKLEIENGNLL